MGNLNLTQLSSSQNNKETTINDIANELDLAMTDSFTLLVDNSNAGSIPTADFRRNVLFVVSPDSPAPTGTITVTVPALVRGVFVIINNTAQTLSVGISGQSEAFVSIPSGTPLPAFVLTSTGANVRSAGGGSGGSSTFLGLTDTPSSFTGQAGNFSRVNSGETALEFASGFSGGAIGPWQFIGSHTLSGTALDITALGDSSHRALMFVVIGARCSVDDVFPSMRLDFGSGFVTTATYHRAFSGCTAGSVAVQEGSNATSIISLTGAGATATRLGNAANESLAARILVFDPHATGIHKRFSIETEYTNSDGNAVQATSGGHNNSNTGAITGVRFIPDTTGTTTFTAGTVLVFGLRASNPALPYRVSGQKIAAPSSSEIIIRHVFESAVDFADDFAGSVLDAGVAATSAAVFTVKHNGSSVGTITVSAAGTTGTFATTGGALAVSAGDTLSVEAPGTPDSTLAQIAITFAGTTASP